MMSLREEAIRKRLRDDFPHYAEKCLSIRTKLGDLQPLKLNAAQRIIHTQVEDQLKRKGLIRKVVLKGRQQGASTYIEGRLYWKVTHRKGVRAYILCHDQDASNNLFEMAQRYHDHCPAIIKPKTGASNAKELHFTVLDSGYKVATAGSKGAGRSATIQYLHGSEVAFWPNAEEHAKGIVQAVSDMPGTEIFLESTANGIGNYFHQQWQMAEAGGSEFEPIFLPWFLQPEYTRPVPTDWKLTDEEFELKERFDLSDEHLSWRRNKILQLSVTGIDGSQAFRQEYPNTPSEAFSAEEDSALIKSPDVEKARTESAEPHGPLIMGLDPARFGIDRTALMFRQGRVAYGQRTYNKTDIMEVVGIAVKFIREKKPDKVFVDVAGVGAGVVDRLKEMGYGTLIRGVNGGEKPLDAEKYSNKRAEMWGEMAAWLKDRPCQIPDSDELHADLTGPHYKFDSKSRLMIERKDEMKRRGIRSPDLGDALALTFAEPVVSATHLPMVEVRAVDDVIGY